MKRIITDTKNDNRPFIDKYNDRHSDEDRVVFGHIINSLGTRTYKFLGVFKFNLKESIKNGAWTYERVSSKIELPEKVDAVS